MEVQKKILVAFDFDNTIINCNSDTIIWELIDDKTMLKKLYDEHGNDEWTSFMNRLFVYMKDKLNISLQDLKKFFFNTSIQLTPGMKEMFDFFRQNKDKFDVIIVSDANTYFIQWILEKFQLEDIFSNVFTNFGHDQSSLLYVENHHKHECKQCPPNICKQKVLTDYIKKVEEQHKYQQIFYVGDGGNDYCPLFLLQKSDIAFARTGYCLEKKVKNNDKLQCGVQIWDNATEILDTIKQQV